ncbi:spermidine synthase [Corynebacterium sp. sy039]|uniref:spermidine synthase n=1 Tax=Corynebacterium sp. sy039 TaxID=2599641 RepID=UPI00143E0240|nr:fused MFS/spermidine synthase [Corynebacterium sp. sy039]
MGRKRLHKHSRSDGNNDSNTKGIPSLPGVYQTSTGCVEIKTDPYSPGGYEIFVNGVPSSHIAYDPLVLEYEYMRWIAAATEFHIQHHAALSPEQLRITHLGGGACTLARYFAHRYPQSRNTVIELDAELARLVRTWFDLPRAPRLKIRQADARAATRAFVPDSRDIIIRDVFTGSHTPAYLATREFYEECARSLSAHGLYIANCGDDHSLSLAKSELHTMRSVFAHCAAIADPPMFKGRRRGNIILLGAHVPLADQEHAAPLRKALLGGAVPAHYHDNNWVQDFSAQGRILSDAEYGYHDIPGTSSAPSTPST